MTSDSALGQLLQRNRALRRGFENDIRLQQRLQSLRQWQSQRLQQTYSDLHATQRYRPAVDFFVNDLYGSPDLSRRDDQLLRGYPVIERMLPAPTMATVERALQLEVMSQELDTAMVLAWPGDEAVEGWSYAEAYRRAGRREEREQQIRILLQVGHDLDRSLAHPMLYALLKMLHRPAHLAGFGALQDFLERGFSAFKNMQGADEFLATIERRETRIMESLFAGGSPLRNVGAEG